MKLSETGLPGVFLIDIDPVEDERGFFARTFCLNEFSSVGISFTTSQCNISYNRLAGTLRGMHFQVAPFAERKVVRCTRGKIFDVVIDLRGESSTCGQWLSVELHEHNRRAIYLPEGVAHGFLTLADDTEVFYQMSEYYHAPSARGVRWNDPRFKIRWPRSVSVISERDKTYPDYTL